MCQGFGLEEQTRISNGPAAPMRPDGTTGVAARKGWSGDADEIEKTAAKSMFCIPVGRVGRADEIAGMVAYLSSSWAGYIHGANIHINGGVIGTFT